RLGPVDLDEQVVLPAVADLAGRDGAQRPVLVADRGDAVVVELAALGEGLEQAANLLRPQPGDVPAEVVGVGADVAEAPGGPALARVGPPRRLLLVALLQPGPEPPLDVVRPDGVDLAQFAVEHHLPGLPDERVAGVVVG